METRGNRPRGLLAGGRIAVVAPSGPVDLVDLQAGVQVLRNAGFDVSATSSSRAWRGIFSGPDDMRLMELQRAFDDPDVRAVWMARGGYGLNRLLPGLRLSASALDEKVVIGFSDATALLTLVEAAGGHAIHGPMVAHDLVRESAGDGFHHLLEVASGKADWAVSIPKTLRPGKARGPVRGGCLTVLASLLGTPWAPVFKGSIALLEDHYEAPQRRIDRLLIQLRQSGALDGVQGIFFGAMEGCGPESELHETILDCLGDLEVPIGFGAPVGHGSVNRAVPFGRQAEIFLSQSAHGEGRLVGREGFAAE